MKKDLLAFVGISDKRFEEIFDSVLGDLSEFGENGVRVVYE